MVGDLVDYINGGDRGVLEAEVLQFFTMGMLRDFIADAKSCGVARGKTKADLIAAFVACGVLGEKGTPRLAPPLAASSSSGSIAHMDTQIVLVDQEQRRRMKKVVNKKWGNLHVVRYGEWPLST